MARAGFFVVAVPWQAFGAGWPLAVVAFASIASAGSPNLSGYTFVDRPNKHPLFLAVAPQGAIRIGIELALLR